MYYFLVQVGKATMRHVKKVSWGFIFLLFVLHASLSAILMALAQEWHLLSSVVQWMYYYVTTASSIGYGDLSPQNTAGRLVAAVFLMPGAIGLFAAVLGKTTNVLINYWRKHHMGKGNVGELNGHTVIVGWHKTKGKRVVNFLKKDVRTDDEGIVVVDDITLENPMPDDGVRFVKAETLTDEEAFDRAGVNRAAQIIVRGHTDSETLASSMAILARPIKGHVIANFTEEKMASLLKVHHPEVECVVPTEDEMLVRAAQDPGSSAIIMDLMSLDSGPTQYSATISPAIKGKVTFGKFLENIKNETDALLIAVQPFNAGPVLNPSNSMEIRPGDTVFYIGTTRLKETAISDVFIKSVV